MKTTKSIIVILFTLLTVQAALAWYDPSTQRWLSRDPMDEPGFQVLQVAPEVITVLAPVPPKHWIIRDLTANENLNPSVNVPNIDNLYIFVNNNPANEIDPNGLRSVPEPPSGTPTCYTKNNIPADVKKKLTPCQLAKLNKTCLGPCCVGILAGGGIVGGFCISCTF